MPRQNLKDKLEVFGDENFIFNERSHSYYYKDTELTSVTKYISNFHKKFDENFWAEKKSQKTGVPVQDILLEWKAGAKVSTDLGTQVHKWIENYFLRVYQELPEDPEVINRINKFNKMWVKHLKNLEPVTFEQKVFSQKLGLAGTIDSIFLKGDVPIIIDWKSNKKFTQDLPEEKCWEKLLPPFQDWCKNHLNEYSIQISLYRLILEEVGINIHSGYLVHLGPGEDDAKIYKCHDFVPFLKLHFFGPVDVDLFA
ncbi:hypothetical protein EBU71_02315 [bacterium]|nr:hypothetical protein [Candidatus Elulimicrobium humile]